MTRQLVHLLRLPIRWGDMDALGHVNNIVYFQYIEQARIAWLEQVGCLPGTGSVGPVIVNAHCSFIKQLTYPGEIEVSTLVGSPGRSSFEMEHEIRLIGPDGQAGEVHAKGGTKVVWVDFGIEKSVPLPDAVRALLTPDSAAR